MNKKLLLFALLGVMLASLFCCKSTKKITTWLPPANEFAFIEYYQTNEGKVLEGIAPSGRRIDGPTYTFNQETGEVHSYLNTGFNKDSIIVLLGRGLVLRGTRGGGMHSRLIASKSLPVSEDKITINGFLKGGLLSVTWEDKELEMNPGDVWLKTTTTIDTLSFPDSEAIVENTTTYSIKFFGYLKKDKFTY
jgi:hypothetical protein